MIAPQRSRVVADQEVPSGMACRRTLHPASKQEGAPPALDHTQATAGKREPDHNSGRDYVADYRNRKAAAKFLPTAERLPLPPRIPAQAQARASQVAAWSSVAGASSGSYLSRCLTIAK